MTPTRFDTVRARFMFLLAFAFLLAVAGLIHRAQQKQVTQGELNFIYSALLALWPIFVVEAVWGVARRDRAKPLRPVFLRALLVIVMPPWRMAQACPRTGLVWLPRVGWAEPSKELYKRVDKAFSGPMLLVAFLILPVLGFEYVRAEQVKSDPALALALHVSIAVIWVAFATEFILEGSIHPKTLTFLKERWLDAAIVILPMLEFILTKWVDAAPLARLLRLGRALSPEQIARMQQLYRLRGLIGKAWAAFLLLGGMGRLLGNRAEKRLKMIDEQIAALEEQIAELRKEAEEVRATLPPPRDSQNQPPESAGRDATSAVGADTALSVTDSNRPSGP
ncbi:MAG TPA: hypothetical protein VMZ71_07575 [Gemmataceae bacterium]|nr:hypothetical protein [Gemmataceae bacterium]